MSRIKPAMIINSVKKTTVEITAGKILVLVVVVTIPRGNRFMQLAISAVLKNDKV
jgi:hypothetical protein